jgi:hypothetical protein
MPYIAPNKREHLDPVIDELQRKLAELEMDDPTNNTEGNLNYVISTLLNRLYTAGGYASINAAVGLLQCIALEYYTRHAVPYEAQKAFENGDVYDSGIQAPDQL